MKSHVLVGFGFGPIQAGLFVSEAFQGGNFSRIIIAEIDRDIVSAIRKNNGSYYVNVAKSDGIEVVKIDRIEIYNPSEPEDRKRLLQALSESTEIVTSLPSVSFYDVGSHSVASLIEQGLKNNSAKATIIYTAENNNHAAEILEQKVNQSVGCVQFLNTVIGKMSQVVTNSDQIAEKNLATITPEINRAFLVEEFNKILATKCNIAGFKPGIEVFIEKEDLLPFEEAKLHGHNAIHALLSYLGAYSGYTTMKNLSEDVRIMQIAKDAFINESGSALIKKYSYLNDPLFTVAGFNAYAEDLLTRMTNPYLDDSIERTTRDPIRKLGLNDRFFGTMALAISQGIEPVNMALGAMAGIIYLLKRAEEYDLPVELRINDWRLIGEDGIRKLLFRLWGTEQEKCYEEMIQYVQSAAKQLQNDNSIFDSNTCPDLKTD